MDYSSYKNGVNKYPMLEFVRNEAILSIENYPLTITDDYRILLTFVSHLLEPFYALSYSHHNLLVSELLSSKDTLEVKFKLVGRYRKIVIEHELSTYLIELLEKYGKTKAISIERVILSSIRENIISKLTPSIDNRKGGNLERSVIPIELHAIWNSYKLSHLPFKLSDYIPKK